MNRHVIKGRGANRGKYLCWARMAPEQKPTEDGFVWLPNQRKAVRWEDPRYGGHTWSTDRARVHNGYFVRLVALASFTAERVGDLRSYIAEHASNAYEEVACYWIHGAGEKPVREAIRDLDFTGWNESYIDGEGTNFCADCADEVIEALRVLLRIKRPSVKSSEEDDCGIARDGGWDTEHDSTPFCAKCGVKLSGSQTDYCTSEELSALTDYAAPDFDEPNVWRELYNAIANLSDDDPRWRKIAKVVEAARSAELRAARAGLLSLLKTRVEQRKQGPCVAMAAKGGA